MFQCQNAFLAQREGDSKHVISRLQFIRIQFWECKKFKRPFLQKVQIMKRKIKIDVM